MAALGVRVRVRVEERPLMPSGAALGVRVKVRAITTVHSCRAGAALGVRVKVRAITTVHSCRAGAALGVKVRVKVLAVHTFELGHLDDCCYFYRTC
jgi:hypothetical protein